MVEKVITRAEFIDGYMEHSILSFDHVKKTEFGFVDKKVGTWIAMPCNCSNRYCLGWAMMPNSLSAVAIHCDVNLPEQYKVVMLNMRCTRCKSTWPLPFENLGMRDGLVGKMISHQVTCPVCHTSDFIHDLTVESYELREEPPCPTEG
jgi:hypothetical protein